MLSQVWRSDTKSRSEHGWFRRERPSWLSPHAADREDDRGGREKEGKECSELAVGNLFS